MLYSTTAELLVAITAYVELDVLDVDTEAETDAGVVEGADERVAVGVSETSESVRLYAAAQAARSIPWVLLVKSMGGKGCDLRRDSTKFRLKYRMYRSTHQHRSLSVYISFRENLRP